MVSARCWRTFISISNTRCPMTSPKYSTSVLFKASGGDTMNMSVIFLRSCWRPSAVVSLASLARFSSCSRLLSMKPAGSVLLRKRNLVSGLSPGRPGSVFFLTTTSRRREHPAPAPRLNVSFAGPMIMPAIAPPVQGDGGKRVCLKEYRESKGTLDQAFRVTVGKGMNATTGSNE